ncbi:MAG: hypothetical protein ACLU3D_01990 [Acutalibacteraceae bacterium]
MKKIKIGDHVRGTAGSANMFTGPDLIDAVVLDVWEEGAMLGVEESEIELIEEGG